MIRDTSFPTPNVSSRPRCQYCSAQLGLRRVRLVLAMIWWHNGGNFTGNGPHSDTFLIRPGAIVGADSCKSWCVGNVSELISVRNIAGSSPARRGSAFTRIRPRSVV